MPFCSQCGKQVNQADVFCAGCGGKQPVAPPPSAPFSNLSPRNASLLCYIPLVGWIPAIVILASKRFKTDKTVRFHAFQGLYIFVAWLIVDWAVGPIFDVSSHFIHFDLGNLLKLAVVGTWIFMLVKTSQNELFRLPVLGELADRSIAEQR
jgi:uncharacterized membrane protein